MGFIPDLRSMINGNVKSSAWFSCAQKQPKRLLNCLLKTEFFRVNYGYGRTV